MNMDRDERHYSDLDRFDARRNPDDSCKRPSMGPAEPPRQRSGRAMLTPCEEEKNSAPSRSQWRTTLGRTGGLDE
jgi:hypothetical protein